MRTAKSGRSFNGYTQVDNTIFDYILPTLPLVAQSVFMKIVRQTFGWQELSDRIPLSQFRKFTGIRHNQTIRIAVDILVRRNLISVERESTKPTLYVINALTIADYNKIDVTLYDPNLCYKCVSDKGKTDDHLCERCKRE